MLGSDHLAVIGWLRIAKDLHPKSDDAEVHRDDRKDKATTMMRRPRQPQINWTAINMCKEMGEEFAARLAPLLEALGPLPTFSEIVFAMKEAGKETAAIEGKRHRTHWYDHHSHILDPLADERDTATKDY